MKSSRITGRRDISINPSDYQYGAQIEKGACSVASSAAVVVLFESGICRRSDILEALQFLGVPQRRLPSR